MGHGYIVTVDRDVIVWDMVTLLHCVGHGYIVTVDIYVIVWDMVTLLQ